LREEKSQPLILGGGKNQNQRVEESTPHFGRVGYGKSCSVTSFNLERDGTPRPRLTGSTGFTSMTEISLICFLIWFFSSVI